MSVPRLWPGSTVVCLGTGPSLTPADVDACRGKARVIAVNDAYLWAKWADALYACDRRWWALHQGVPGFQGLKFGMTLLPGTYPDVQRVKNLGTQGLSPDPAGVMTGGNSGYQAINLAVHLGAARILLLGYDLQPTGHFFGHHPSPLNKTPKERWPEWHGNFATLTKPLAALGIEVVNCSRITDLTVFPRMALAEALAVEVAA